MARPWKKENVKPLQSLSLHWIGNMTKRELLFLDLLAATNSNLPASVVQSAVSVYTFCSLKTDSPLSPWKNPRVAEYLITKEKLREVITQLMGADHDDIWLNTFIVWAGYWAAKHLINGKVQKLTEQENEWFGQALKTLLRHSTYKKALKQSLMMSQGAITTQLLHDARQTISTSYTTENAKALLYHDLFVLTALDTVAEENALNYREPVLRSLIHRSLIKYPEHLHHVISMTSSQHDKNAISYSFPVFLAALSVWVQSVTNAEHIAEMMRHGQNVSLPMASLIGAILAEGTNISNSDLDTLERNAELPPALVQIFRVVKNKQEAPNEKMHKHKIKLIRKTKAYENSIEQKKVNQVKDSLKEIGLRILNQKAKLSELDPDIRALMDFIGTKHFLFLVETLISDFPKLPYDLFTYDKKQDLLRAIQFLWFTEGLELSYETNKYIGRLVLFDPERGYTVVESRSNDEYVLTTFEEMPVLIKNSDNSEVTGIDTLSEYFPSKANDTWKKLRKDERYEHITAKSTPLIAYYKKTSQFSKHFTLADYYPLQEEGKVSGFYLTV